MAAFNNGFPVTYPQYYPYPQMVNMPQPAQQPQPSFTPPTIHADIVQVDNEQAAANFPVGAGSSQMMIAKDDSAIFVKSALPNGQTTIDVFIKRPPAPPKPEFDPGNYVTWDKLEERLASLTTPARKTSKEKEVAE